MCYHISDRQAERSDQAMKRCETTISTSNNNFDRNERNELTILRKPAGTDRCKPKSRPRVDRFANLLGDLKGAINDG